MKPLGWEVKRLRVPWDMVSLCSCLNVDHWEHYRYFRTSFSTNWYVVEYVFICGAWIPKDDDGVCPRSSSYSIVQYIMLFWSPFRFLFPLEGCRDVVFIPLRGCGVTGAKSSLLNGQRPCFEVLELKQKRIIMWKSIYITRGFTIIGIFYFFFICMDYYCL